MKVEKKREERREKRKKETEIEKREKLAMRQLLFLFEFRG